ncbi:MULTISPECIES: transcription antitermination factor NusB [unclassified Deinococcus]|uniref:transcription antitermination factor NusB n=5 Tax=Deinococcus TaxID=1298 RepID=UPI00099413D7|nr:MULTISPECIES: transcription antitermination factor NusB [unclassified Deinococcus]MBX8463908.1 transcription antitermination factor NusB [Deinococcus sp. RIT780]OOV15515.1 transcription antitermination factor NusB [Deinococcus sp. LM3]PIG99399.1 transcription antitermination factor NusB [Deinococcus sp. UR1]
MTRRREKAAAPVGTRRAAREFAFRVLFEADRGDLPMQSVFTRAEGAMRSGDDTFPALSEDALVFAQELVRGISAARPDIDATLRRTIRGWSFDQMAQTDLNILRLATFEMMYTGEPHPPVIESAVRIARKFGGDDSGRFVNGVLAGLSRSMPRGAGDTRTPEAQTAPARTEAEAEAPLPDGEPG